jgi:hypothetical protein
MSNEDPGYRHVNARNVRLIFDDAQTAGTTPVVICDPGGLVVGGLAIGDDVYVGEYAARKLAKAGRKILGWPRE